MKITEKRYRTQVRDRIRKTVEVGSDPEFFEKLDAMPFEDVIDFKLSHFFDQLGVFFQKVRTS